MTSIWNTTTTQELLDERQKAEEVPFIGQQHAQDQIRPFLKNEHFPHLLLIGDPGLGKTQFAKWVAWMRDKPFFERIAPIKPQNMPAFGVMLLDEIHRQNNVEDLFPAMDRGMLSILAATTKPNQLDAAFKSRFLITLKFRPYTQSEMVEIIMAMSEGEASQGDPDTLASASAGNPRVAERIVKAAQGLGTWNTEEVLKSVRINADGLSAEHFEYLAALDRLGRPTGVEQMSVMMMSTADQVKQLERHLMGMSLVELRSQGRALTVKGAQYVALLKAEGEI